MDRFAFIDQAHQDLGSLLIDVERVLPPHYFGFFFGFPVLATLQGAVCTIAVGMDILAFRLPQHTWALALASGGKACEELGQDWIQFNAWKPDVSGFGDPQKVRDDRFGPFLVPLDEGERQRIAYFGFWCKVALNYAATLT